MDIGQPGLLRHHDHATARRRRGLAGTVAGLLALAPALGFGFALTPLNLVDPVTGQLTGSLSPSLDEAPRWSTASIGDGLSFGFGSWTLDINGRPVTRALDTAGFYGLFSFGDGTTVERFQDAVAAAFSAWAQSPWPGGIGPLSFAQGAKDVATPFSSWVPDTRVPVGSNLLVGNEIDIFGVELGAGTYGKTVNFGTTDDVELTNGFGFDSIGGLFPSSTTLSVDLGMNTQFGTQAWTIDKWQSIFTHELGHALGLGDVDATPFWDNDDDVANLLPINEAGDVREGIPFAPRAPLTTARADGRILMCSACDTRLTALQNDDLAGIRFLYPMPEPGSVALVGVACIALGALPRRRRVPAPPHPC